MSGFATPQRGVRKRKSDTLRKCPNCSGNILPGERQCPCAGRSFECPTKPLPDTVLQAAHYYHLFKSMRTGTWAKTGYIAPHNFSKQRIRAMFDGREQWFSIRSSPVQHSFSVDAVEYFIFRCECAHRYWRDERAMLMGTRMELWAAGVDQQKVCDCLGITRDCLRWLDQEIRQFVWFPPRSWALEGREYWKLRRKIKTGVANDIIRRWKHGYKQSQAPEAQQDRPLKTQDTTTYEGGIHVEVRTDRDAEGTRAATTANRTLSITKLWSKCEYSLCLVVLTCDFDGTYAPRTPLFISHL
jgi:hypothetical protein